jgi:hypothetical protein
MASTYLYRQCDATASSGYSSTWTWSGWVKRSRLGSPEQGIFQNKKDASVSASRFRMSFGSSDKLLWECKDSTSNDDSSFQTNMLFRDTNAWYHIVFSYDSTQSTEADRLKLWVNGVDIRNNGGGFSSIDEASNGFGTLWSSASKHFIGYTSNNSGTAHYFDGLMSHVHFTYGTTYTASTFGETDSTTGEWKIKTSPSVTYGSQGYFMLKNNASVTDQSGEGNNFTASGTLTKTEDNPSNVFATLNPLLTHAAHGYSLTYGLGNNKITFNEPSTWTYITSTTAGINGKFYAEFKVDAVGSEASIGVIASDTVSANQTSGGLNDYLGKETDSIGYLNDGRTFKNNSAQQTGLTAISAGNILGVALDTENNTCQFYINGSSSGNPVSLTADKFYHFGVSGYNGTQISCNFGNGYFGTTAVSSAGTNASNNGIFEYDVPTGYTALSTKGLNQ